MKKCGSAAGIFVRSLRVASSLLLALGMVLGLSVAAHAVSLGDIVTVAGNGIKEYSGDGGPAISAGLNQPTVVTVDQNGNLYIADIYNHRIRKVTADTGIITTVAGTGIGSYSGDGGLATSAGLKNPYGVAVDAAGNLYIADTGNHRIRKVDVSGIVTTVAGNGIATFSGDGGPATSASLFSPSRVAVDNSGNLYISDEYNYRVRKVDAVSHIISTVAGNGTFTTDGDGEGGGGNIGRDCVCQGACRR